MNTLGSCACSTPAAVLHVMLPSAWPTLCPLPHMPPSADTFHKPGFKLQTRILHHLFTVAQVGHAAGHVTSRVFAWHATRTSACSQDGGVCECLCNKCGPLRMGTVPSAPAPPADARRHHCPAVGHGGAGRSLLIPVQR